MIKKWFFLLSCLSVTLPMYAVTLKVGVLAPDGTSWAKNLKKMAQEVSDKTKDRVKLHFFFNYKYF